MIAYRAPAWLPGGQLQTIWPALHARRVMGAPIAWRRERWDTPDGDFVDVDWLQPSDNDEAARPLLVLFHGLEGSSRSHYAEAFAGWGRAHGLRLAVPHFRGCSGALNRAPRAYHCGDCAEVGWLLQRFHARQQASGGGPLLAVGASLGGNALLLWLGTRAEAALPIITAGAAICPPLDLTVCGDALGRGFNRVYSAHFLGTLKRGAEARLRRFPDLFDPRPMRRARSLRAFDDAVTAPLHGFAGVDDYWRRASSKPLLQGIRVPALVLNPRNDPFLPAHALPTPTQVSLQVRLEQPAHGGHVGFVRGGPPGHLDWLPRRLLHHFRQHC